LDAAVRQRGQELSGEEGGAIMNQVSLAFKDAIRPVRQVLPICRIHTPLIVPETPAISTFRVDKSMKNSTTKRRNPRPVHTSTVKKSAATISSQ